MSAFERGLDDDFVDELNKEYDRGTWWRRLVDDPDLYVAVRKNYVNVYYRGGSLAKVSWKAGQIAGEIHYKYLLRPSLPKPYVDIVGGRALLRETENMFVSDLSDVDNIKKAASPHAGLEKIGVHNIVKENRNVVDVEIAFGVPGTDEDGPSARRIDFAALRDATDDPGVEIVFFEAKHFDNSELRAKDNAEPRVIDQIRRYGRILTERRGEIIDSYRRIFCNLLCLHGMSERYPGRREMLKSVIEERVPLNVDETVVLVVFGFDGDQGIGKIWKPHRKKLKANLGKGKVLFRGNAGKFVRGISR